MKDKTLIEVHKIQAYSYKCIQYFQVDKISLIFGGFTPIWFSINYVVSLFYLTLSQQKSNFAHLSLFFSEKETDQVQLNQDIVEKVAISNAPTL